MSQKHEKGFTVFGVIAGIVVFALACVSAAAWVTHVVVTIHHEQWFLLAVGGFIVPVGVIHGVGLWFGIF